jgi:hypothetical protein
MTMQIVKVSQLITYFAKTLIRINFQQVMFVMFVLITLESSCRSIIKKTAT